MDANLLLHSEQTKRIKELLSYPGKPEKWPLLEKKSTFPR